MKHSDIQVTAPKNSSNQLFHQLRKLFFLAGYLALMAVATGIASPVPIDDPVSSAEELVPKGEVENHLYESTQVDKI